MNKNMKPGPKPRKTTQEFFEQIEHHASRGLSQQQICHALGISETWWYEPKHKNPEIYRRALKKDKHKGLEKSVTQSMSRLWQDPLEQPASSSKIEIRIDGLM